MNRESDQVRKFYEVIWNSHNKVAIPDVLHENITFRGSLGQEKKGHIGFEEYLDYVHESLAEYHCEIEELVGDSNKVFAKMKFSGIHKGEFMGFSPSGKKISWAGAALFTFEGEKITDLWVLGDIKSLVEQLCSNET